MSETISNNKEPMVTILYSDNAILARTREVGAVPLSRVDDLFRDIDRALHDSLSSLNLDQDYIDTGYQRTDFLIDYVMGGKSRSYDGRYDLGDGDGSLVDHIEATAREYVDMYGKGTDPDSMEKAKDWEKVLDEFVPYLQEHVLVAKAGREAEELLNRCGDVAGVEMYCDKFHDYVETSQQVLNCEGAGHLPEEPDSKAFGLTESPASMLQHARETAKNAGDSRRSDNGAGKEQQKSKAKTRYHGRGM